MTLTPVSERRPRYQSFTPAEDAQLRALAAEGKTAGQIAAALGTQRTRNTVAGRAKLLGVTLAPAPAGRRPDAEPPAAECCPNCKILYSATGKPPAAEDGRCAWCVARDKEIAERAKRGKRAGVNSRY